MTEEDGLPRLPTVDNDLENVTRSVNEVLDKIVSLPVGELMQEIRKLVASTQAIVASPDVAEALRAFNSTMNSTDRLMSDIGTQAGPLIASLRRVGDSTDATVKRADTLLASMNSSYGRDSQIRGEMQDLLKQLQETAKSVKYLASYLEQHPEALVRGKAGNP
jgi:paraquat-inducible protein B